MREKVLLDAFAEDTLKMHQVSSVTFSMECDTYLLELIN